MWVPRINKDSAVKYTGIADAIEADIKRRLLKPGDKLPAQRVIAEALNIDLTTVTRAINEAAKRGLVETQPGSGCFVAQTTFQHYNSISITEGKLLDLSMNNPPQPPSFKLDREVALALKNISEASDQPFEQLNYQETAGHPNDRQAGMTWLLSKIPNIESDRVLITNGAHSALFSILSLLKKYGIKSLAAPDFSYPGLRSIADHFDIDIFGIEMDHNGLIPESLERLCQQHHPQALYLIPNIDNPTTTTIPLTRRTAITDIAKAYDLKIIEDDPYFSFLDAPIPSFYSLLPENTWHIATLSKCISPALRVAYVVAPNINEALSLAEEIRISHLMAPPLMTAVASYWIQSGLIDDITAVIKFENISRLKIATDIFDSKDIWFHPAGPHFWLRLSKVHRALDFAEQAERSGISIVPSTAFVTSRCRMQAVRISLGVAVDHHALKTALTLLAELHKSSHSRSMSII